MAVLTPLRGIPASDDWNGRVPGKKVSTRTCRPGEPGRDTHRYVGDEQMVLWPAVSLIGFLALTALVIALGTRTTARYEREQRSAVFEDNTAAEPAPPISL